MQENMHFLGQLNYAAGLEEEGTEKVVGSREDNNSEKVIDLGLIENENNINHAQGGEEGPTRCLLFRKLKGPAEPSHETLQKPTLRPR